MLPLLWLVLQLAIVALVVMNVWRTIYHWPQGWYHAAPNTCLTQLAASCCFADVAVLDADQGWLYCPTH